MKNDEGFQRLYTERGRVPMESPWGVYPRPQLIRDHWLSLNGKWKLFCNGNTCDILVPFCPESLLSTVDNPPEIGDKMIYERDFIVPPGWQGERILLHFGAVSGKAIVSVNGNKLLSHTNSYLPFTIDITDYVNFSSNKLSVTVVNDLDPSMPYGKQSKKRGGMWYTPCSGIWQTVWLEPVPDKYVKSLRIVVTDKKADIEVEGIDNGWIDIDKKKVRIEHGKATIGFEDPILWTPEDPFLYSFRIRTEFDDVKSYLALRTLETKVINGVPRLCLNGKPYFFNGILDQGYWSDGLYTPATPDYYAADIRAMKSLGFNTLRKHVKIEPEQFYYDCDRYGMIVFQDMVNNGSYHFFKETALPNVGLKLTDDHNRNTDAATRQNFIEAMSETVKLLGNHSCICLWTIFNEGWGQFSADSVYRTLKDIDGTRFVDSTSGWFRQELSDVDSEHNYFRKITLPSGDRPKLLSEFGGYVWKIPEHSYNLEKTYGYRLFKTREDFVNALVKLYRDSILPLVPKGLCGAIYTQVSDVEDETNGLLTFDRSVSKIDPVQIGEIMNQIQIALNMSCVE